MKNIFKLLLTFVLTWSITIVYGQITTVNNNVTLSKYASAIGKDNVSTGYYSTAIGRNNQATGNGSFSFGFTNYTIGEYSVAIGSYLKTTQSNSIIIGSGLQNTPMENNIANSVMIGGFSNLPTLIVFGSSSGIGTTGKIGIGNVTSPLAKLHLRADEGEDAAIYVQPHNWLEGDGAGLALGDMSHGISAMKDKGLIFNTSSSYNFNGGLIKYGMDAREGSVLLCTDSEGTAVWAQLEMPAPSPWLTSGTNDIYFSAGKVGIGTINTYGYELAVLGKILADEVMIKHPVDWGDYVFKPEYKLMPVNELAAFVKLNSHLPGVPSEKEVSENGYGLAQMNEILLKKVEELTLYIIQQQEMLQKQQEISQKQQDEINKLKEVIY